MARSGSFSSTVTATSRSRPVMWWARATPTMPPPTIPTRRVVMAEVYGSPGASPKQSGRGRTTTSRNDPGTQPGDNAPRPTSPGGWMAALAWALWALTLVAFALMGWFDRLLTQAGRPDLALVTSDLPAFVLAT